MSLAWQIIPRDLDCKVTLNSAVWVSEAFSGNILKCNSTNERRSSSSNNPKREVCFVTFEISKFPNFNSRMKLDDEWNKSKKTNNPHGGPVAFLGPGWTGEASRCLDDTTQWAVWTHATFPIIHLFVFTLEFAGHCGKSFIIYNSRTSSSTSSGWVEHWSHYSIMCSTGFPPLTSCTQMPFEFRKMLC